eukprot:gene1537-2067_t
MPELLLELFSEEIPARFQRKAAEEEINYLAYYDPLTRLPNRRLLMDRLQQALVALKKFVSGISHSAIQKLANDQISRYVDELMTLHENVDFFVQGHQLVHIPANLIVGQFLN